MKKSQLWKIYVAKNPAFERDGNVTLSTRGLRKLFDQTWDLALHEGEEEHEPTPQPENPAAVADLMKIFGMS
ncbi:MAG: hypothetical protein NTW41_05390 [Verrucomicrobia bacterium]|nr:hypothetical protein [Verrucomicrobiota bacterium]